MSVSYTNLEKISPRSVTSLPCFGPRWHDTYATSHNYPLIMSFSVEENAVFIHKFSKNLPTVGGGTPPSHTLAYYRPPPLRWNPGYATVQPHPIPQHVAYCPVTTNIQQHHYHYHTTISVARGGGGAGGGPPPPIMPFRSFVGTFGNLSVHLEICRYM